MIHEENKHALVFRGMNFLTKAVLDHVSNLPTNHTKHRIICGHQMDSSSNPLKTPALSTIETFGTFGKLN